MSIVDWVPGDHLGLNIPAHAAALRAGGEAFLTEAFRKSGALSADNRVQAITEFRDCPGGSTGRKVFLSVAYEKPAADLPEKLFVKFSRDFDDARRDASKGQLEPEVRLALLSRTPGFPIAVPACLFADYHQETGTGVLITQRISFGRDGIEPQHEKCLDYEMPEPLEHYKALIKALARLAGTHKSGKLHESVDLSFPFTPNDWSELGRIRFNAQQISNRVARYAAFAQSYPHMLRPHLRAPDFLARLAEDAPRFPEHEAAIKTFLHSNPDFIALCHWNANIDNAWFWRNEHGALECGLMDWGGVSQMNLAMALWGALSGAETEMLEAHLDTLLEIFAADYHASGGPRLEVSEIKHHMILSVALMGLAWLLDASPYVEMQFPNLAEIENRFDPRFKAHEAARVRLQMLSNVLGLFQALDAGKALDRLLSAA